LFLVFFSFFSFPYTLAFASANPRLPFDVLQTAWACKAKNYRPGNNNGETGSGDHRENAFESSVGMSLPPALGQRDYSVRFEAPCRTNSEVNRGDFILYTVTRHFIWLPPAMPAVLRATIFMACTEVGTGLSSFLWIRRKKRKRKNYQKIIKSNTHSMHFLTVALPGRLGYRVDIWHLIFQT